jgi:LPXTG-motif cell wall-anchored protein|tara:strand:- start:278 stop:487 length:210 start_codon:yes stop_codon:yes gene_type:complete
MKGGKILVFLIFVLFGLYFINSSIEFYPVPDFVSEMNNWIFLIGGVLILIGGASILMHRKKGKVFGFPQ